ncbi:putative fungal-specific transcription factor [Diplogelasinospora grovesii]|uniref:Fungal-specific transcription factor n=1 Tax=Diplogelasinospora grovesii TaxID=303347 RepID=A0AAN6N3N7_9PEZI|nr:putative fungal-specific transcription factor [Diplogelasinospora grovesii]
MSSELHTVSELSDSGGTGTANAGLSVLACYECKRRKVKCNRALPICSLCQKNDGHCEYPTHPEKPGPKTGIPQRNKRRRLSSTFSPVPPLSKDEAAEILLSTAQRFEGHVGRRENRSHGGNPHLDLVLLHGSELASTESGSESGMSPSAPNDGANSDPSAPIFSQIMYPSHESQTRPQSPSTVDAASPEQQRGAVPAVTIEGVCEALRISKDEYRFLMESYFANIVAFSLFRPGSIEAKFASMQSLTEAEALVAAMFSFSARFDGEDVPVQRPNDCSGPSYFADIASSKLERCLNQYGDIRPPFWVLQAHILVTFYQLTQSVRSRSWRTLGNCIRLAYDMNLHLIDANRNHRGSGDTGGHGVDLQRWSLLEERRRAWWAIWEMDVFASTIRRLPTAMDWSLNWTLLPVHDRCWFNDIYQDSCYLANDCNLRWKHLAQSGNASPRAWFIVINSLMLNTQRIVYDGIPFGSRSSAAHHPSAHDDGHVDKKVNQDIDLSIMANILYCTVASLPVELSYHGETLDFRKSRASDPREINFRQNQADRYEIHLMIQLCRFMIHHHRICAQAPWAAKHADAAPDKSVVPVAGNQSPTSVSDWSNYMNASGEIITVVRNSSRDHHKYVSPFLCNILWFAAAAQCACSVFGPPCFDKRLTNSNLDLLKLTIDRFILFWGGMESLKGKLARIETGLKSLMANARSRREGEERSQAQAAAQSDAVHGAGMPKAVPMMMGNSYPMLPAATEQQSFDGSMSTMPPALHTPNTPFVPPDLYDFSQPPFIMADNQNFFTGEFAGDCSPFGIEELLISGIIQQIG